jgi:PAS domain S-box-containing protein
MIRDSKKTNVAEKIILPVHDYQQLEQEKKLVRAISAIIKTAPALSNSLLNVLNCLRQYIKCELIEIWLPDIGDKKLILAQYAYDYSNPAVTDFINDVKKQNYTACQFTNTKVWSERKPVWYNLEKEEGLVRRSLALEKGFATALAFPVMYNKKIAALIYLFDSRLREQNPQLEKLLSTVSNQLAVDIDRRKLQLTLTNYFDVTSDFYCVIDTEGLIHKVNKAFTQITGKTEEDILNTHFTNWVYKDDIAETQQHISNLALGEISYSFENRFQQEGTAVIWILWTVTYVADGDYYMMLGRDMTSKKQIADSLAQSETRYRSFINHSTESIYRYEIKKAVPVTLPVQEQMILLCENAILSECNEMFAKRYGYDSPDKLTGKTAGEIFAIQGVKNYGLLEEFIKNNYSLHEGIMEVYGPCSKPIILSNSAHGIIENNCLVRVWGTSKDITREKNWKLR